MFFLIFLLVAGVTYSAVEKVAPTILAWIALSVILMYPLMWLMWVSNTLGFESFLVNSWQSLSGVSSPGDIVPECASGPTLWALVLWVLPVLNAVPGFVAIFGLPIGAIWSFVGGLRYLLDRNSDWLKSGIGVFGLGLLGVVLAGLVMRLTHFLYSTLGCSG